jgi:hypothetical protein
MAADISRRLRFNGRNFTLLSQAEERKDFNLCQICSLEPNCLMTRRINQIMEEYNLSAPVTECPSYRPRLVFRPPFIGLDDFFNTIRIGKAWAARLPQGTVVSLRMNETDEEIGIAQVATTLVGTYDEIAKVHAPLNHMMLEHEAVAAPALLHKVLTRCYGTTFFNGERHVSVIYLQRLEDGRNKTDAGQAR